MSYFIYILKCSDKTLYTGYTDNLEKRVNTHNTSKTGAKYTKARRPVRIIYSEKFRSKSKAMKREWEIKQMNKKKKLELIKNNR